MYRFLIIEGKNNRRLDDDIIPLFCEMMAYSNVVKDGYKAIIYYEHEIDLSFDDVILNVMSDTLTDLRIYVSHHYPTVSERDDHISFIQKLLIDVPFSKYHYIDDKILVKHYINRLNDDIKCHFMHKFYRDQIMIDTLKAYLDSNLNMVIAAKKLYIHRNTLIQRIDKFHQATGFDIRVFGDALLVYHLIN